MISTIPRAEKITNDADALAMVYRLGDCMEETGKLLSAKKVGFEYIDVKTISHATDLYVTLMGNVTSGVGEGFTSVVNDAVRHIYHAMTTMVKSNRCLIIEAADKWTVKVEINPDEYLRLPALEPLFGIAISYCKSDLIEAIIANKGKIV